MSGVHSLQPGSLLAGKFRIVRLLGHGGMGTVYEAIHEGTGAARALKLMLPQFAEDPRFLQRFSQEARISALIDSEHVVQVLDVGFDKPTRTPYLVMELLRGESLASYVLRKRYLSHAECRAIFTQIFHGICAAHDAGVVHRDLKPENIFLARARREGVPFTVKILDFGIAKMMAEVQATATVRLGSPLWVAPEQTEASPNVHPSADLWALGLLAFFCLTGRSYWLRANEADFSIPALMRELLFEPLPPASERAEALHAGGLLPPGFDAWFARCVHREPSERFASAAEARDHLMALLPPDGGATLEPLPEMTGTFARAQFPTDFPLAPALPSRPSPETPQPPALAPHPSFQVLPTPTLATLERLRSSRRYLPVVGGVVALTGGLLLLALLHQPTKLPKDSITNLNSSVPPLPATVTLPIQQTAEVASTSPASSLSSPPRREVERPSPPRLPSVATAAPQDRPVQAEEGQGFLSVVCRPYCDAVQIRGRDLGPTPLLRSPLAPGTYTARLLRKGIAPRTIHFTIQRGQTTSLRVNLEEPPPAACQPPYSIGPDGQKRLKPECREL
ncbi:MAG: serine/threonine-protein kinase [Myxococcales bacterium]|nr:protein kinase [Polyangiaceae bacterium]MDW8247929.1 serine/threonine-protein kinase [Myxococcales bacterium]